VREKEREAEVRGGGRRGRISIPRGDPINDGALSDAFTGALT